MESWNLVMTVITYRLHFQNITSGESTGVGISPWIISTVSARPGSPYCTALHILE